MNSSTDRQTGGVTRREFAAATAAVLVAPALSTAQPSDQLRVRRNVATLGTAHPVMQAYIKGVRAMKALPESDVTSWLFQASIHRTGCAHANWFFLPWHRAYLLYFEEVCRAASGYDAFALPY